MSAPAAVLSSQLHATTIQDHEEILQTANKAIKVDKADIQAQHTRVVALLKLDRFDDALRAIAEGGDRVEKQCLIEKAYALYKSGELTDAQETLKTIPDKSSRAARHLAAQVAYRAEKFEHTAEIYRELAAKGQGLPGEENDLRINTLATNAQLEWKGLGDLVDEQDRQPVREDFEAFETAYNSACGCVARGDFSKASVLLKRARDLCSASEDLSDDEKKAELLPIMVQHVYVFTRLGKEDEAAALQKSIAVEDISEVPTKAVAENNVLAMGSEDSNPFLTRRLMKSATTISVNDGLFEYQASILRRNEYALDLKTQKFEGVERSTCNAISKAPTPTASTEIAGLGVISAAAHARLGAGKAAIKHMLPMLEKRRTDVGLLLTIMQLYVQTQNAGPALNLLESFLRRLEAASTPDHQDVRFTPGLVAVTVAMYRLLGRQNSIRSELSKAATHWRSRSNESSTSLLRAAGVELLKSSNPEHVATAGATFENIASSKSKKDTLAAAGMVASFATTDYDKAEAYLQNLTPIDRLTAGTDVDALISAGIAPAATTTLAAQRKRRGADAEPEKSNKRRRKPRLPKNYDGGKMPDPERWLPLRDRSTYRPKGKKGKKRAQESTQGGIVREEETLELVGGAGAVKVEKATAGANKKKKKGKK